MRNLVNMEMPGKPKGKEMKLGRRFVEARILLCATFRPWGLDCKADTSDFATAFTCHFSTNEMPHLAARNYSVASKLPHGRCSSERSRPCTSDYLPASCLSTVPASWLPVSSCLPLLVFSILFSVLSQHMQHDARGARLKRNENCIDTTAMF